MPLPDVPRATYRVQLNARFGFKDAAALVPYLARLGISHLYCSPYLKTRPGSEHGYDVIDHAELNPELGTVVDYEAMCAALERHGMGQVLDIVPNHVGVMGSEGKWWLDVLENGQASAYADYFDIDWEPVTPKLRDKVLVPVLGDQYGNVLAAGELKLVFDEATGEFAVHYFDHKCPLDPASYPLILQPGLDDVGAEPMAERAEVIELQSIVRSLRNLPHHSSSARTEREVRAHEAFIAKRRLAELNARSEEVAALIERNVAALNPEPGDAMRFERLHRLLELQPYRLAYWRVAADEINYRRFFDINDLAGLRTQNEEVLEATHRRVLEWVAEGKVHGLRIDHPDGLYDPHAYLEWLRARLQAIGRPNLYVVVEKILAAHEHLPRGWPVAGTTGYDFTLAVNGLFVHAPSEHELDRVYREHTRDREAYEDLLYRCKQQIIAFHLSSELTVLANLLNRIAEARLETRDFTLNAQRAALLELVAAFPVYRSYVTPEHVGQQDRGHIEWAVSYARQAYGERDEGILDFVRKLLLFELPPDADEAYRRRVALFTAKFQQLTSPVMAKALEDTCFYRYVRLLSLNEVGGDPRRFGITPAAYHRLAELRLQHWPASMLATSTHDSKRSEDVRARINVISEMPEQWRQSLQRWRRLNRAKRRTLDTLTVPSRHEEYMLYQTLVGTWPGAARLDDEYRERIASYMLKAAREAKVSTSWSHQNGPYEERLAGFVADVLATDARNPFVEDLDAFAGALVLPGQLNSLGTVLLKLTSPGVPDVYQGNEAWDFSLVDPDNRRPVDYARRIALLDEIEGVSAEPGALAAWLERLWSEPGDPRPKLYVTWCALQCRAASPTLFERGAYLPLEPFGPRAEHLCAFAREHEGESVVVVVGRWFTLLEKRDERLPIYEWEGTAVPLPSPGTYRNVLTDERVVAENVSAEWLFRRFPAALLVRERSSG